MLYISRKIGLHFYGVVDTDDCTEEEVTRSRVSDIATGTDLVIHGVQVLSKPLGLVGQIVPYQPVETKTPLQTKTLLVKGIEVVTYKNIISAVRWKPDTVNAPVSIRLSDYGSELADCILFDIDVACHHVVTLVLDDKVKVANKSFWRDEVYLSLGPTCLGVVFDLREMTNVVQVTLVYEILFKCDSYLCLDYIIDDEARKLAMRRRLESAVY